MSVKVMSWVWSHSRSRGTDRLVLLAIADHCDHDGENAWPKVVTLAEKTGVSQDTVRRAVRRLEKLGELEVDRKAGGNGEMRVDHRPNLYRVLIDGSRPRSVQGRDDVHDPAGCKVETGSRPRRMRVTTPQERPLVPAGSHIEPSEGPLTVLEPSLKTPVPTGRARTPKRAAATTATTARAALARTLVSDWWDERKAAGQPSAQKFIAVAKVVEGVLANGVTEADVAWALRHVPTVSAAAIEMALSRRAGRGRHQPSSTAATAFRMLNEAAVDNRTGEVRP